MSKESKNKANVRRLNEAVNKASFDVLPELFAADVIFHMTPVVKGLEGLKQTFTSLRTAFPDYTEKLEYMFAEGDLVATFYTLTGTFTGQMAGIVPTGKKFRMPMAILSRFKDGKQAEAWPYYDNLTWYQQLGIPLPK